MTARTLDLPSHTDPAAVKEVAALLREHIADDQRLATAAWEWSQQAAPDRAQAEEVYWRVLDAAGVEPEATTEQPAPERDAPASDSESDAAARNGTHGSGDDLAALEERIKTAQAQTYEPMRKWRPEKEPILCGTVVLTEALDTRSRDGIVRIVILRRPEPDGSLVEVWCSLQQLAAGLRQIELHHARALRPGDLLALRHTGTARLGRSQHESKLFAIEAVLNP